MRNIVCILFIVTTLFACSAEDTYTLPSQPSRLVVNSIGQTGNAWNVRVTKSHDVLDLMAIVATKVPNATVTIYEDGAFKENLARPDMPYGDIDEGFYGTLYQSTSVPVEGKEYTLAVSVAGEETVTSTFVQPKKVTPKSLSYKITGPGEHESFNVQFDLTFVDPPGENYYEVQATSIVEEGGFEFANAQMNLWFVDPVYKDDNDLFFQTICVPDTYFDNQEVTLSFLAKSVPPEVFRGPSKFKLYLRSMSKEYYNYQKTTNLQRKAQRDAFAQPVLIENNITNGYGIFGGFTQASVTTPILR